MKEFLARWLIASGALRLLRVVRRMLLRRPALIILCYHRIADEPDGMPLRSVSPREFEAQLELLRRDFEVWPLHAVPAYLRGEQRLSRDTLVLTFDDGYLDGHRQAAPILERHGLRATFFVSTGPCLDGRPYWMDQLDSALARAATLPSDRLPVEIAALLQRYVAADASERPGMTRRLVHAFMRLGPGERERILAAWGATPHRWVGPPVMTIEHLHDLFRRGHEIGGHGVNHPVLARLDDERCRFEIESCVARLREQGLPVAGFAYPFGGPVEVGDCAPAIARQAGVSIGVTTEERAVRRRDDPLRLPRKVVHSQPLAQIAVKLEKLAWGMA